MRNGPIRDEAERWLQTFIVTQLYSEELLSKSADGKHLQTEVKSHRVHGTPVTRSCDCSGQECVCVIALEDEDESLVFLEENKGGKKGSNT